MLKNISSVVADARRVVCANFDTRIGVRALITVTQGGNWVLFDHWYGKQYRNNQ